MVSNFDIKVMILLKDGTEIDVSDDVVQYADNNAIGIIPTWSLTLPHEYKGTPYAEFLNLGDIVTVELVNFDHRFGTFAEPYTVMVGMVNSLNTVQTTSENSVSRVASLAGTSIAGPLLNESLNYFLLYGYLENTLATKRLLPPDEINSKDLASALFAYTTRIAFEVLQCSRPQGEIEDMLSLAFASVDGIGLFDLVWLDYEGSFWGFLQSYSEQPLNELMVRQVRDMNTLAGQQHVAGTWGTDSSHTALVMRPTPFPYSVDGSSIDRSLWDSLPVHDLLEPSLRMHPLSEQMSDFDDGIYNAFFVHPKLPSFDQVSAITYIPAVVNVPEFFRHGYRPLSWETYLCGTSVDKESSTFKDFFTQLNWRVATQNNRLDGYRGGSVSVRLSPHVFIGERVLLNHIANDDTTQTMYYVKGVAHNVTRQSANTTLTLDRGLPVDAYDDDSVFLDGLRELNPLEDALAQQGHAVSDVTKRDTPGVHRVKPQ